MLYSVHCFTQARERKIPYSVFLEKSVGFSNPTTVSHLAAELGLDVKSDSLMRDLRGRFPPRHTVTHLRREQASKWAFKHVAQGIKHFKSGNNVEAFQCLNQALNIDSENVEGLVARGALYANNGGLDKAVEDFESALKINRHHKNAKKYMCETLIAVARNLEEEDKIEAAIETYQKIILLVPDHKDAQDSILFLRGRPKDAPLRDDKNQADSNKPRLSLDDEKEKSEKKKKKKKRRRSSVSSSSSSSSTGSERRRKKKKRKEKHRSRSPDAKPPAARQLSPFSVKLAPDVAGTMNLPEGSAAVPPPAPAIGLPDVRLELDRIRGLKAVEERKAGADSVQVNTVESSSTILNIDLTVPPPGYPAHPPPVYYPPAHPAASRHSEREYDDKVRRFLEQTGGERPGRRAGDSRR